MRWKLSALVVACLMTVSMSLPAFAAVTIDSVVPNATTSEITVSGTTTEASENIIVTVVPQGADITTEEGFFNNVKYQNTIKSENGTYSLTFKLANSGLFFDVMVSGADSNDSEEISYIDRNLVVGAIDEINDPQNASNIDGLLETYQNELGLFADGAAVAPNWAAIAAKVETAGALDTNDVNATILFLKETMLLQYVTDGGLDNVFDHDEILNLYNIQNNDVFESLLAPSQYDDAEEQELAAQRKLAFEQATTKLLKGISFTDKNDFDKKVVEKMILAFVANPDGAGNAKAVMEAYASLIGIDTTDVHDSVYNTIVDQTYATLEDLKTAFAQAVADSVVVDDDDDDDDKKGGSFYAPAPNKNNNTGTPATPSKMFYDLDAFGWAVESIEGLASRGFVSGKGDKMYYPADAVTRSEYVKMLIGALGITAEGKEMSFSDVVLGNWDYNYIQIAYSTGIIDGLGDGTFGGNQFITRQDMAVIMYRALKACGRTLPEASTNLFADDAAIAGYAKEAAYVLRAAGVFSGDENNNMNPLNLANRAEAAKVIYSVIK